MAEQQAAAPASAPAAAAPGTPAHDAAMVALADKAGATVNVNGQPAAQPAPATRPDHVPEKFWDAATGQVKIDDVLKSYAELERTRTQQPAQQPANQPAPVVADGKPNFEALTAEFAQAGKLSDASYTALEAAGIARGVVDAYIAGQQALQSSRDAKGYEAAGGKESFDKMATWAATALTPAEQAAVNAALAGPEAGMLLAVAGLKAKYEAAMGSDPKLLGGSQGGDPSIAPFASMAEMSAAMKDPRYKTDEAYRQSVYARAQNMGGVGITNHR